eukprot:CAMPEP_0194346654 /NCGR_PEP_ID=MMETSP0171-20130528/105554_1 /TAXON_ID=218684 /ORGANISM="Corethron pennatum, Strain L29A3" /LENGTH=764 /DNA_ID=CAMNT_0039113813 /DNA_START=39 /DNA_END=2329 /DNA_ORIENTATION=-
MSDPPSALRGASFSFTSVDGGYDDALTGPSWSYQNPRPSEIFSLHPVSVNGRASLLSVGTETDSSTGKKSCGLLLVDPTDGTSRSPTFDPFADQSFGLEWEAACTDVTGPDGGGYAVTGYAEKIAYVPGNTASVVPTLRFSGGSLESTVEDFPLAELLRETVEARHYAEISDALTAREMRRPVWSHYPVRVVSVHSDMQGDAGEEQLPVADLVVLLSSSPSAVVDDAGGVLDPFVTPVGVYDDNARGGYTPPVNFKYGDADEGASADPVDGPGRGISVLRVRLYQNGTVTVPWSHYQHANGETPYDPKSGATAVPTDMVLQRCHPKDRRCPDGYIYVSGHTDGRGSWFFGANDPGPRADGKSSTEGFVTRLKLDTGEADRAYRAGSPSTDHDDTVNALCSHDPYVDDATGEVVGGALYAVGTSAGTISGASISGGAKYDAFVAAVGPTSMNLKHVVMGSTGGWGAVKEVHTEHDIFGGGCVADNGGVHVIGTVGSIAEDDPSRGMNDVFVVSLTSSLTPRNFNSTILGTPADDSAHGLIHGGGAIIMDPTDSSRLIVAGNSAGSMYTYSQSSSDEKYARAFLATVDIRTGAHDENLAQKCLELTDYETTRGILCKEHALTLRLRTNVPTALDIMTLRPTEETQPTQTNHPTESDKIYTAFPSSEVPQVTQDDLYEEKIYPDDEYPMEENPEPITFDNDGNPLFSSFDDKDPTQSPIYNEPLQVDDDTGKNNGMQVDDDNTGSNWQDPTDTDFGGAVTGASGAAG